MSSELSNATICYGLYHNEKIIGFIAIIHFPHPKIKNLKKVHRLVILPDYQGIGLGIKFLNAIGDLYTDNYDFRITTSAKNLIYGLNRSRFWSLTRYGRNKRKELTKKGFEKSSRGYVKTATFKYCKNSKNGLK